MAFHMEAKTEGKLLFRQRDHRDVSFSKTEFNSGLPRPGLVELNKPPTISSLFHGPVCFRNTGAI